MNCLNQRKYDRDKCLDVFQAYRDCKKAWVRLIIPSLYTLATSRMLIVPRDETMQGRSPGWEGINGVMHVKVTNMIQRVLIFIYEANHPPFPGASVPPAYLAPRSQGRIRAARDDMIARTFSAPHG